MHMYLRAGFSNVLAIHSDYQQCQMATTKWGAGFNSDPATWKSFKKSVCLIEIDMRLFWCVCVNLTLANPSARVRCHSSPQGWQSH